METRIPDDWRPIIIDGVATGWAVNRDGVFQSRTGARKKGYLRPSGYRVVSIQKKEYLTHRLVAATFISAQPSPSHTVDHVNQVRDDNRVDNLRWASKQQQIDNRTKTYQKLTKKTKAIEYKHETGTEWLRAESASDLSLIIGKTQKAIGNSCLSGRSVLGYTMRYVDEPDLPGEIWKIIAVADFLKFRKECITARAEYTAAKFAKRESKKRKRE